MPRKPPPGVVLERALAERNAALVARKNAADHVTQLRAELEQALQDVAFYRERADAVREDGYRCAYCGERTGGAYACRSHADLLVSDPEGARARRERRLRARGAPMGASPRSDSAAA